VAVEEVVSVRNERSALAAESDVRGTKVGDGGDSSEGGDDGRFTDLQSRSDRRKCLVTSGEWRARSVRSLVEDSLAVRADEGNICWRDAEFLAGGKRGFGEEFSQAKIKLAEFSGGDGLLLGHAENFFSDGGWKFN